MFRLSALLMLTCAPLLAISMDEPAAFASPRAVQPEEKAETGSANAVLHDSVCVIRATKVDGTQEDVGIGFVVADDGRVVTSRSLKVGATGMQAIFEKAEPMELEPVAEEASLDLIILRLVRPDGSEFQIKPVDLRPTEAAEPSGSRVFTAVLTNAVKGKPGQKIDARDGTMGLGLVKKSEFADKQITSLNDMFSGKAVWVESIIASTPKVGAPVLDASGKAVGIVVDQGPTKSGSCLALSAVHVQDLLVNTKPRAFKFAEAKDGRQNQKARADRPVQKMSPVVAADQLNRACDCRDCSGKGKITVSVRTGWESLGGAFRKPIMEKQDRPCKVCGASGRPQANQVEVPYDNFAQSLRTVDVNDIQWKNHRKLILERLQEVADKTIDRHEVGPNRLGQQINNQANDRLRNFDKEVPPTIAFVGRVRQTSDEKARRFVVDMGAYSFTLDDVTLSHAALGDIVFVCGTVQEKNDHAVTLSHAAIGVRNIN